MVARKVHSTDSEEFEEPRALSPEMIEVASISRQLVLESIWFKSLTKSDRDYLRSLPETDASHVVVGSTNSVEEERIGGLSPQLESSRVRRKGSES